MISFKMKEIPLMTFDFLSPKRPTDMQQKEKAGVPEATSMKCAPFEERKAGCTLQERREGKP